MKASKPSWTDNEAVGSLEHLAQAVDRVSAVVPDRRHFGDQGPRVADALPLQNLPAHLMFARHWEAHRASLLGKVTRRACPVCGGTDRGLWFPTQDGYQYDYCRTCGMIHIADVLPLPVWDEYFRTLPDARGCLQEQMTKSVADAAMERDRTRFSRYVGLLRQHGAAAPGSRVLDMGSFTGAWLRIAAEHGIDARGVEGLEEAVRFAQERFPSLQLVHARSEELPADFRRGQFDVVTMWETLEHTFDPVGSLELAAEALRPGGTIAISVPNARNVQFSALGQFCFYAYGGYHGTGHINMFSPRTLSRALEAAGFDVTHVSTEFGTDWRQVFHYLRQDFERIHCYTNLVRHGDRADAPGTEEAVLLNWLSPTLTRFENACLAGPIMIAIARKRH